jgi:GNAT superfamily N-acetyltransferase
MSATTVRVLTEDHWSLYRELRLAALQESPETFVDSYDQEVDYGEDRWRARMTAASRLIAEIGGRPVGIVSTGVVTANPALVDVFGLWVTPEVRQAGVAWALMEAAVQLAADQGRHQLFYWVGNENMRAIAFASNFGFLLGPERRPARLPRAGFGQEEVAMVYTVGADPAAVPNSTRSRVGASLGGPDR